MKFNWCVICELFYLLKYYATLRQFSSVQTHIPFIYWQAVTQRSVTTTWIKKKHEEFANYANMMVVFVFHNLRVSNGIASFQALGRSRARNDLIFYCRYCCCCSCCFLKTYFISMYDSIHCLLWHTIVIGHYIFIRMVYRLAICSHRHHHTLSFEWHECEELRAITYSPSIHTCNHNHKH